jgi:hypothetical protein
MNGYRAVSLRMPGTNSTVKFHAPRNLRMPGTVPTCPAAG